VIWSQSPAVARFERPPYPPPTPRQLLGDFEGASTANGIVAAVFAMTGPVAVVLAVGADVGLGHDALVSWIFGVFVLNGLLTVWASWLYRQPLSFFWTLPGTVIVGQALTHVTWPEVLGAFVATGVLITVLGLTGRVHQVLTLLPVPVVMAMVAGAFLRFGLDLVDAVLVDTVLALPMVLAFVVLSGLTRVGRWFPPLIGTLIVGLVAVVAGGRLEASALAGPWVASPQIQVPVWSWAAAVELVVPLVITVLVVQNGQGMAVLNAAGHRPPMNVISVLCGLWSMLGAAVGAAPSCLTGPTNALLVASGKASRQYTAGVLCGLIAVAYGVLAPGLVRVSLALPATFIVVVGGLAMLKVLEAAFAAAFDSRHSLAAVVTFVVVLADATVLNIGGAFWGLLAGVAVARMSRGDR
jgi:benzoate membrane transport protein